MAHRPLAILIAGPTASGKSAAAVALARRTGGVVVNADSMQVYSVLRVLTARPDEADLTAAGHRLFGHVHPAIPYSTAQWLADVVAVLEQLAAAGRPAIVVGGTGLYFKALEEGLSPMPAPDPAVRRKWRQAAAQAPHTLHGELARRDPQGAAKLAPGDTQRLVRALEMVESTGMPLHLHQARRPDRGALEGRRVVRFVIEPPRATLHRRIESRLEAMVARGALDEVAELLALGLDPAMPAMKAIGVRQFGEHLRGALSLDEAVARTLAATRQYAKRQSTWFRGQFSDEWLRADEEAILARFADG